MLILRDLLTNENSGWSSGGEDNDVVPPGFEQFRFRVWF